MRLTVVCALIGEQGSRSRVFRDTSTPPTAVEHRSGTISETSLALGLRGAERREPAAESRPTAAGTARLIRAGDDDGRT